MEQGRPFEVNVADLDFPFLSTDLARAAVQTEIPATLGGPASTPAKNISPQIASVKNVLPVDDGYSSVDRRSLIVSSLVEDPPDSDFQHVYSVVGKNGVNFLIGLLEDRVALCITGTDAWTYAEIEDLLTPVGLTFAHVDGELYLHFAYTSTKLFDADNLALVDSELVGLEPTQIIGITSASNYLIAYDFDTIYWDSQTTRADFTPISGGAGSAKLSQLTGKIIAVFPLANGFIVYSQNNMVGAQYTGNPNFPWVFREINNSSGITTQYNVACRTNLDSHLAWTKSGLQQVNFQQAILGHPKLTEFLNKRTLETFDFTTGFVREQSEAIFAVKLELIGHRYLACSFGPEDEPEFTQAWIYDLQLKRWGKLEVPHVALTGLVLARSNYFFSYAYEDSHEARTYEEADLVDLRYNEMIVVPDNITRVSIRIGSVNAAGQLYEYDRSNLEELPEDADFSSQFVLSRIAWLKNLPSTLFGFELNSLGSFELCRAPDVSVFNTLTGDGFENLSATKVVPYLAGVTDKVWQFLRRQTANFHVVGIRSRFELKNILVNLKATSRRQIRAWPALDGEVSFISDSGDDTLQGADETVFTIKIENRNNRRPVSVRWATEDGIALAGTDYEAASGILCWEPGDEDNKTVTIDMLQVSSGDFFLDLSDPLGCTITEEQEKAIPFYQPAGSYNDGGYRAARSLNNTPDSKQFSFVIWAKFEGSDGVTMSILETFSGTCDISRNATTPTASMNIRLRNQGLQDVWAQTSASEYLADSGWHCFMASIDADVADSPSMWVDDVLENDNPVQTVDAVYSSQNNATIPGASTLVGCLGPIWINDSYIDFRIEANRRKFLSAAGKPVYLGEHGELPTGTPPRDFFPNGDPTNQQGERAAYVTFQGALTPCDDPPELP